MATYRTSMWGQRVEISGNFHEASSPVYGVGGGLQVADFRHNPTKAMRAALEELAAAYGYDTAADDICDDIETAIGHMIMED